MYGVCGGFDMNLGRVVLIWLCSCAFANAAEGVLTLDDAVRRALSAAPQVLAAQSALQSARDIAPSAGRLPDPEAIVGIDNLPVTTADAFSLSRDFMTMRKVGVMQSVPNAAKRSSQRNLASREVDLAEAQWVASRFVAARAAANAWIDCAIAAQSLRLLRARRQDLATPTAAITAAIIGGNRRVAEALAGETALARLDSRILELEQQLATRRAELSRWVDDDSARELGSLPWQRDLEAASLALIQNVEAHAPLAPATAEIELARAQVQLAQAQRRPDWSAELSYANRGSSYSDMVSLQFRVGLPLFARHRQNPVIASRLADLRTREAEREAEIRMHRAEIESLLAQWRSGRQRLQQYLDTLLPLAADQIRATTGAYGAGRVELAAVIGATAQEIELQIERIALEGEISRAWVFLHLLHSTEAP
jgi:outer membrane protein TolC